MKKVYMIYSPNLGMYMGNSKLGYYAFYLSGADLKFVGKKTTFYWFEKLIHRSETKVAKDCFVAALMEHIENLQKKLFIAEASFDAMTEDK